MSQRIQSGVVMHAALAVRLSCVAALLFAAPVVLAQTPQQQPPSTPATSAGSPQQDSQQPQHSSQQEATPPTAPVPVQQATPGTVPVPKAVPSMMPAEPGDEVDRVVAIVNGQVILDSDVDEEHRFEAIQPYPNTAGMPTHAQEMERLVNRALILQQARLQTEEVVTDAEVDTEITGLRKTLPACKQYDCATEEGWARYLASNGFTVQQFRNRWKQRMQVLAFIQERFGAGTTVSGAQIREFYQNTMLPQYKKAGVKPAPLTEVESRIRQVLEQQQVSNLLRDWLQSLRAQGSITILHPGEEAP